MLYNYTHNGNIPVKFHLCGIFFPHSDEQGQGPNVGLYVGENTRQADLLKAGRDGYPAVAGFGALGVLQLVLLGSNTGLRLK